MTEHTCHVPCCDRECKPEYLMCKTHWFMVPKDTRSRVWQHYQPGQEHGVVEPTEAWHDAADDAINAVVDAIIGKENDDE